MVSRLACLCVDNEIDSCLGQVKNYTISICRLSPIKVNESKDWLARSQDNVTECVEYVSLQTTASEN